jgi:hypothetical protein
MRRYKTSFTFINCESHVYSFQGFGGKRFLLIAQEKSATCKSDFITNPKLLIPPILFLQNSQGGDKSSARTLHQKHPFIIFD